MAFLKMSRTVLKSLVKRPYTVKYPFGPCIHHGEISRGSVQIDIEKCIFCGLCQKKCLTGAIRVEKEAKKWEIDRLKCIVCASCVEVCPKKCLVMARDYTQPMRTKISSGK